MFEVNDVELPKEHENEQRAVIENLELRIQVSWTEDKKFKLNKK